MQDYLLIGGELDGERMALPDGVVMEAIGLVVGLPPAVYRGV